MNMAPIQGGMDIESGQDQRALLSQSEQGESNLQTIAGVIESTDVMRLQRLLFRVTRGKAFIFTQEYPADE